MTREEALKIMEANPPTINEVMIVKLYFAWEWQGCGFGECFLAYNEDTRKWEADTECMGKESVRKFLHALADHIADQLVDPT